jgi:hypothetical protein
MIGGADPDFMLVLVSLIGEFSFSEAVEKGSSA